MSAQDTARAAKEAVIKFSSCTPEQRNQTLENLAELLDQKREDILTANNKDILAAQKTGLRDSLLDRLKLDNSRIDEMIKAVEQIRAQDEVVGEIVEQHTTPDGLFIQKQRIPLGVIAMIFESRPNVVIDCSALAIKSGNAMLLKGGKEALHSNRQLCRLVQQACEGQIPTDTIQLIEAREDVAKILKLKDYIDVMIPRGSAELINYVYENAAMPVIAHFAGLCHGYVHKDANTEQALKICLNAKAQRTSVCNAMETLLLDEALPDTFAQQLVSEFQKLEVELRVDAKLKQRFPELLLADDDDWRTEYLDKILSIKQVANVEEAISHIQKYGTKHTEFICTENEQVAKKFQLEIDASCIMVNASTRFNDGSQLGLGAELGISTSKLHAYGPMGTREMTTTRFLVIGHGHIRV